MVAAGGRATGPVGTITGVAPRAWLGNYKVFGSPGVNGQYTYDDVIIQALEDAYQRWHGHRRVLTGGAGRMGTSRSGYNVPGVRAQRHVTGARVPSKRPRNAGLRLSCPQETMVISRPNTRVQFMSNSRNSAVSDHRRSDDQLSHPVPERPIPWQQQVLPRSSGTALARRHRSQRPCVTSRSFNGNGRLLCSYERVTRTAQSR